VELYRIECPFQPYHSEPYLSTESPFTNILVTIFSGMDRLIGTRFAAYDSGPFHSEECPLSGVIGQGVSPFGVKNIFVSHFRLGVGGARFFAPSGRPLNRLPPKGEVLTLRCRSIICCKKPLADQPNHS